MDHSIIHSIIISTAALIHRTGTSIWTLIHGIAILVYANSLMISFLALSSTLVRESQGSNASNDQIPEPDTALR